VGSQPSVFRSQVPYVPLSHPFVERLVGTIRREYLDQTLFWTTADLEEKLQAFQD
jgi:putative transposase